MSWLKLHFTIKLNGFNRFLAGLFIGLGLTGVIPAAHFIAEYGWYLAWNECGMGWLVLMAVLYISGALLYAARIPEKYFPGTFDIWVSIINHCNRFISIETNGKTS